MIGGMNSFIGTGAYPDIQLIQRSYRVMGPSLVPMDKVLSAGMSNALKVNAQSTWIPHSRGLVGSDRA